MIKNSTTKYISCIIPARNEGRALLLTVRNLASQILSFLAPDQAEIIIIDDASEIPIADKLPELQQSSFAEISLRLERSEYRLGSAKARNVGANIASGTFLLFLDAHVSFAPGSIEALLTFAAKKDNSIVGASVFECCEEVSLETFSTGETHPIQSAYFGWNIELEPEPRLLPNFQCPNKDPFVIPIVGAASLCLTSALFQKLGCFESELSGSGNLEDSELCIRAWRLGYSVFVHPQAKCLHLNPPEKQELKKPVPDNPFCIPWYTDCEENIFRFSFLALPEAIHQKYFSDARPGKEFLAELCTFNLKERREKIEVLQIFSAEEIYNVFQTLPNNPSSHYRHGLYTPNLKDALRARFQKDTLLLVSRRDLRDILLSRGVENVYDVTTQEPALFEDVYLSFRSTVLPTHELAPNWQDLILSDIALQYLSPAYLLEKALARVVREKQLLSIATTCQKNLSRAIIARVAETLSKLP